MTALLIVGIAASAGCIGGYLYLGSARYATRKALRSARKMRVERWWL